MIDCWHQVCIGKLFDRTLDMGGCKKNWGKEVKNMEFAIYEKDFKNQPLYRNKFNLTKEEQERYLQMVPAWVKKWQEELDKMND